MKKLLSLIIILSMALVLLVSCGGTGGDKTDTGSDSGFESSDTESGGTQSEDIPETKENVSTDNIVEF